MNDKSCFESIVVIGDLMIDRDVYCSVTRLSPEAPVPVALKRKTKEYMGGAGNVGIWLSYQGHPIKLISQFSPFETFSSCEDLAEVQNRITLHNIAGPNCKTIVKERIFCSERMMLRIDDEDIIGHKTPSISKIYNVIDNCKHIVFSDYAKGTNLCFPEISDWAKKKNIKIYVDCKVSDLSIYSNSFFIKMNLNEFNNVLQYNRINEYDPKISQIESSLKDRIASIKSKYNIENIVVTCGGDGCLWINNENLFQFFSVPNISPVNVCGAGDVFLAACVSMMVSGATIEQAIEVAIFNASKSITSVGKELFVFEKTRKTEVASRQGVVFTNGCFDIIHAGHVDYLEKSRALGGRLIVGLNGDASVRSIKGSGRPINDVGMRKKVLLALACVDEVIVFDEPSPEELIKKIKPDIITKGSDYKKEEVVGHELVGGWGGKVEIIDITFNQSSSKIINKVAEFL